MLREIIAAPQLHMRIQRPHSAKTPGEADKEEQPMSGSTANGSQSQPRKEAKAAAESTLKQSSKRKPVEAFGQDKDPERDRQEQETPKRQQDEADMRAGTFKTVLDAIMSELRRRGLSPVFAKVRLLADSLTDRINAVSDAKIQD